MPSEPYCYEYPRPAVTVDLVVFAHKNAEVVTLLVRRGRGPFAGAWAIPGGFLGIDEEIDVAARRELFEETGLDLKDSILLLGIFAAPDRDPRGRTISLTYVAYLSGEPPEVIGSDDAAEAAWRPALRSGSETPLAFDHEEILQRGLDWLSGLKDAKQA